MSKYFPTAKGRKYVFRDVNIEFPDKVNIGVLGLNGTGKSTLINMLSGCDQPNKGTIKIDGSVSWPLGLSGGGIVPKITARENAEFVCRVFSTDRDEIKDKINFIKEFSEIGDYFELPVRTFSSGMKSKLTFAMSMAFDFDIYLIDELTAVGDARFKAKSKQALEEKRDQSNYIMVSHNVNDLIKECDRVIVLDKGKIDFFEDVDSGLEHYLKHIKTKKKETK